MFVWPEYIKIEQSFCAFIFHFLFFQIKNMKTYLETHFSIVEISGNFQNTIN